MEKGKVNEISNFLEDILDERNPNVQLLLFSLLTEDDYDPEYEGMTPFRICYLAVEETCVLLECADSLDKLKKLIIQRKELLNLDRNDFYNNIGEKITEKLSLKPLILEVSDEIIKLETLQRIGLLTTEKQAETKLFETTLNDAARLELCNKIISNNGAESEKHKPIFKEINEMHRATLLYLLGGEYPDKIERIKVCSIGRTHIFLESISKHPHPYEQDKICVPDFLKNVLLQSNGNDILKLKK